MTLLHMDGFEISLSTRYGATSAVLSSTNTRFSYGSKLLTDGQAVPINFPAAETIVTGFAFRDANDLQGYVTFYGDSGATQHVTVVFDQATKLITVRRGNTVGTPLGTTAALSTGWAYYEIKLTIGDGTAGSVIVRKNGVEVINTGGVDTKNGGTNASVDNIRIGSVGSGTGEFDDWYVLNTSGSTNNDFLGDVRVMTLAPNGNGASSQFAGSDGNSVDNYLLVDEQPFTVGGDNVYSSTIGHKDLYTTTNLPATTTTVYAAQDIAVAKKDNAGLAGIKTLVRISATDYASATAYLGADVQVCTNIRETNPNTGVAWTPSDIDGLEVGVEVA